MLVDKFGKMSDTKIRIPGYHLLILIIIIFVAMEIHRFPVL